MKRLLLFLAPLLIFSSCTAGSAHKSKAELYYIEKDSGELLPHAVELDPNSDEVRQIFELLVSPEDDGLISPIPEGTHILDVSMNGASCKLTLNPKYIKTLDNSRAVSDAALTKSICSLPYVDTLIISCDGAESQYTSSSFITQPPKTNYETYSVNLYFADKETSLLSSETRTVSLSAGETLERAVLEALVSGPHDTNLLAIIPKGTVVNDVYINEGTCFVDFSNEFTERLSHTYRDETLALYSVVNTLTELPLIDSVKFLTDGGDPEGFFHYPMELPLTNNPKLIKKTGE